MPAAGALANTAKNSAPASITPVKGRGGVPAQLAFPCATQNELNDKDAATLIKNGCLAVAEGANMPSSADAMNQLRSKIMFAPAKAANAGGVAISGLEMSQNSLRLSWTKEEMQIRLKDIMRDIHNQCVQYGTSRGSKRVDYVTGANIAGFVRTADAMLAHGV